MIHYRVLFRDLLGESVADQPAAGQPATDQEATDQEASDPGNGRTVLDEHEDIHQQTPRT